MVGLDFDAINTHIEGTFTAIVDYLIFRLAGLLGFSLICERFDPWACRPWGARLLASGFGHTFIQGIDHDNRNS